MRKWRCDNDDYRIEHSWLPKPRFRLWLVLWSAFLAGSRSVVVVHSAESACSPHCPLHLSFSCSAVPLNVPSVSEKLALLMVSLCSVVCDSQQKDDRLCFFFLLFYVSVSLFPHTHPARRTKGALSLLAHCSDGDMMARRHSRVNIIRETLFSKLHQPDEKRQENTRKNMAKFRLMKYWVFFRGALKPRFQT